jgi:uncharacterized protein (TIGR00369 family)
MRAVDLQFEEQSAERVRAWVDLGPEHHQPFGIVHGGVYTSIVEVVGSIGASLAVIADGRIAVGVNNNTQFLRSMVEGRLHAEGVPIHRGRTQQLWQVDMTRDDDGALIATGLLRVQVVEPRD